MDYSDDYLPPQPSLLDGDYCSETTEEWEEESVPYSLRLLLEQKKNNEMKKRYFRNDSNKRF